MKAKIFIIVFIVLFLPLTALAHGIKSVAPTVELGGYSFTFKTNPQFPVVGRETHLEFSFAGKQPTRLAVQIDNQNLPTQKEVAGFDLHYTFEKAGKFPLSLVLDDQIFQTELSIKVSALGWSGWWRIGFLASTVLLLLLGINAERRYAFKSITKR